MPVYQVTFEYYINNHFEGEYQVMIPEYLKRVCDETNDYKSNGKRFRHTSIQNVTSLQDSIEAFEWNDHPTEEEYQLHRNDENIPSLFYRELMTVWGFLLTEQLEQEGYFDDQDGEDVIFSG
jgi:hypothetical protein